MRWASRGEPKRLSAAGGASLLAHAATIGLLLLKPALPIGAPAEAIEVFLVTEPASVAADAKSARGLDSGVRATLPSPMQPRASVATAPSPDWSHAIGTAHPFDMPAPQAFGRSADAPLFAALADVLGCATDEASMRETSGRPHQHTPCLSNDRLPAAEAMPSPTIASRPDEAVPDLDRATALYQSLFPEEHNPLFPDKVPEGNRRLKTMVH